MLNPGKLSWLNSTAVLSLHHQLITYINDKENTLLMSARNLVQYSIFLMCAPILKQLGMFYKNVDEDLNQTFQRSNFCKDF